MYSEKVLEHFKNPQNQGQLKDADSIGEAGNQACGDVMKIYLKIENNIIKDIKFQTLGCAAAIAVSSMLTTMAKEKSIEEALEITKDQIVKELGGLPNPKIHCSMLGVEALRLAIEKYQVDNR